jgi:hypothetical protein
MSQRIIRDWTDSIPIDRLSSEEEVLFTRLIMKADDFGNFHGNPKMIKSLCFPLKEAIRHTDIIRWLEKLQATGLIRMYDAKGTQYLTIIKYGQRLRQKKRIFPTPENCQHVDSELTATGLSEEKRREVEEEVEGEGKKNEKRLDGTWNTMPGVDQLSLELPEHKIQATIEKIGIGGFKEITEKQVLALWRVFKFQHFDGEKFYQNKSEVFKHFMNWAPKQDIEKVKQSQPRETGESKTIEQLRELHKKP